MMDTLAWLIATGCSFIMCLAIMIMIVEFRKWSLAPVPVAFFLGCTAFALGMYRLGNYLFAGAAIYAVLYLVAELIRCWRRC